MDENEGATEMDEDMGGRVVLMPEEERAAMQEVAAALMAAIAAIDVAAILEGPVVGVHVDHLKALVIGSGEWLESMCEKHGMPPHG